MIYLLGLVNFVIVKFFGNFHVVEKRIEEVLQQRERYGIWNISIEPFRSISASVHSFIRDPSLGVVTQFFIGNILIFIPLGFLLPLLYKRYSFTKVMLTSLGIIVSIELIQFATCLGIADIDDVILNMFGSGLGYLIFILTEKLFAIRKNYLGSHSF